VLYLTDLSVFIPETIFSIADVQQETGLSREMLSVYQIIYGLRTIPVWQSLDLLSFLEQSIAPLAIHYPFSYLIHVHTARFLLPQGLSLAQKLKNKFEWYECLAFSMTQYKCTSFFRALELLSVLFQKTMIDRALIVTGEIAFTPKLRVIARSTISGDASTAVVVSSRGQHHQLLAVLSQFVPGYSQGIYVSDREMQQFDAQFITRFSELILKTLLKAGIALSQISCILPHNVNIPTWKKMASALSFPIEKIYLDCVARFGHCFCSDHLINLHYAIQENRIKAGDYYVMAGCGMGFYLSASVFRF